MLASLIGVLPIHPVLAGQKTSPRLAVVTETFPLGDKIPGAMCFTRQEVDAINAVVTSERICRLSLIECREDRVLKTGAGWMTWEVVLLTVGVSVFGIAAGVVVGKFAF